MNTRYPFSAVVGQEGLRSALLLNAVDPSLGGLLIRGQKGTGKSTAARALAGLLPALEAVEGCPYHCPPDRPQEMDEDCLRRFQSGEKLPRVSLPTPFVELPLNATEDRLAGTLRLSEALGSGRLRFEPGLLAAANRGILFVDEVNLLEDHLVDLLLDAAASGVNVVEREGISLRHPAAFQLIGTMNPEEGELRPQFLDRFGLCVTLSGLSDPAQRKEIARRRIAYDRDPQAFLAAWEGEDHRLAETIRQARQGLARLKIPESIWDQAVELSLKAGVQGHRSETALLKAASALAALLGKGEVDHEELAEAARFVLPHRLGPASVRSPEEAGREIEALLRPDSVPSPAPEDWEPEERIQVPGAAAAGSILLPLFQKKNLSR